MHGSTGCWRRSRERRDPSSCNGPRRGTRSTSRGCGATSRYSRAWSTASRSPTSTTLLPASARRSVIDAVSRYYETSHANVHRGVHALSQEATDLFEGARRRVQHFINARSPREIVFVRGTTEAINLVAQSWGRPQLAAGRRDPDLAPRAPRKHRALATALRADRGAIAGDTDDARRRGRLRRLSRPAVRTHAAARAGSRVECARHHRARRALHRRGTPPRRARCCSTAPRPCRT